MTGAASPGVGILVMAKEPVAGRVKTRLCPPFTPHQCAALAAACLADTTSAAAAATAGGVAPWWGVALDGAPGPWLAPGGRVLAQRGDGFDERLAAAAHDAGGPVLVIGADTPQVGVDDLARAVAALTTPGTDAVLGPSPDGGYWAIGLRRPDARVFLGVPMSREDTAQHQRARLDALDLRTVEIHALLDVDTVEDAHQVAATAPQSAFATAFAAAMSPIGTVATRSQPAAKEP